jgi:hypothetical protein
MEPAAIARTQDSRRRAQPRATGRRHCGPTMALLRPPERHRTLQHHQAVELPPKHLQRVRSLGKDQHSIRKAQPTIKKGETGRRATAKPTALKGCLTGGCP